MSRRRERLFGLGNIRYQPSNRLNCDSHAHSRAAKARRRT